MQLSPDAFNRHLAHMGQQVRWRRAYACPCTSEHSGAALPTCPQCGGKGHFWLSPGVAGVIGVTAQKNNPKWKEAGRMEDGDVTMTLPSDSPLYEIGLFDRVMLLNATDRFARIYYRGDGDRLDVPVITIDRVFWLNADKTAIVEGGIPTVDSSGVLTWTASEPPAGQQYSITGTRYVEYFAWDALSSDRNIHSGARLPRKIPMRRMDLFGR